MQSIAQQGHHAFVDAPVSAVLPSVEKKVPRPSKMTTLVAETAENPLAVDTEAPVAPAQAQTVADANTDSDENPLPPAAGEPPCRVLTITCCNM